MESSKPTDLFQNQSLQLEILLETAQFLAINKPPGTQVHPSSAENKSTVSNWIAFHYPSLLNVGEDPERPGIVHRLDKDTSGILLIAKNRESFIELKNLFQTRKIQKKYRALVYGGLEADSGIIDAPIARSASFRKQVIAAGRTKYKGTAREASSKFQLLQQYPKFADVEVQPFTGRMHQVRIHMAHIGHPVIGDKLYKNKKFSDFPTAKRQLLHAASLSFSLFGQSYSLTAPVPSDFERFIAEHHDTPILTKK